MEEVLVYHTEQTDSDEIQKLLTKNALIQGDEQNVMHGPDGIYLSSTLGAEAQNITLKSIEDVPELGLGAGDSHHNVSFGEVVYINSQGEEDVAYVAIKKFENGLHAAGAEHIGLHAAVAEHDALARVDSLGFDTLTPAGIVKDGEATYLLTLFRPDMLSLDNENWAVRPNEEGFDKVLENLEFMGKTAGKMNSKGLFHGDLQPKNFARSDTGKEVIIDTEKDCIIAQTDDEFIEAFNGGYAGIENSAAYKDIKLLWTTINRPIGLRESNVFLGEDATPSELYSTFVNHFLASYIRTVESSVSKSLFEKIKFEEIIIETDKRIRNDLGMQSLVNS